MFRFAKYRSTSLAALFFASNRRIFIYLYINIHLHVYKYVYINVCKKIAFAPPPPRSPVYETFCDKRVHIVDKYLLRERVANVAQRPPFIR